MEAIVKWFKAEKGFGFVAVTGGSDAFVHVRKLEAAGYSSVSEGARVTVRIAQGQKGPEVTEVLAVDTDAVRMTSAPATRPAFRPSSRQQDDAGPTMEAAGCVKMYNPERGFGFVAQDGGGKDVFVHATTLARGGLATLTEGQRVRMQIGQGSKGLEARSVELLD